MGDARSLTELRNKVEAEGVDGQTPHCDLPAMLVLGAYAGSLDAAKELHDAVLLRSERSVKLTDHSAEHLGGHGWCAAIGWQFMDWKPTFTAYSSSCYCHKGWDSNPARAWLIAILNALIAEASE